MNSTNLLQHQLDKFGVVTVMDVLLKDVETGAPILLLDTLKVTSIAQEGESKDIRGGIGAPELLSYDFARTVTLEIQDALASMGSLQTLWGGKALNPGPMEYTAMFEATTTAENQVPIPAGVKGSTTSISKSYFIDTNTGESYVGSSIDGQDVTVAVDDSRVPKQVALPVGAKVKGFLIAEKAADTVGAIAIAINSIDIPPTVTMVGSTFFIDQRTGKKVPMELVVPKLKINIGGGLAMEAEGDAAVFDFSGKALADKNKNFFILKRLGEPGSMED